MLAYQSLNSMDPATAETQAIAGTPATVLATCSRYAVYVCNWKVESQQEQRSLQKYREASNNRQTPTRAGMPVTAGTPECLSKDTRNRRDAHKSRYCGKCREASIQ